MPFSSTICSDAVVQPQDLSLFPFTYAAGVRRAVEVNCCLSVRMTLHGLPWRVVALGSGVQYSWHSLPFRPLLLLALTWSTTSFHLISRVLLFWCLSPVVLWPWLVSSWEYCPAVAEGLRRTQTVSDSWEAIGECPWCSQFFIDIFSHVYLDLVRILPS